MLPEEQDVCGHAAESQRISLKQRGGPLRGQRHVTVTERRTSVDWARGRNDFSRRYTADLGRRLGGRFQLLESVPPRRRPGRRLSALPGRRIPVRGRRIYVEAESCLVDALGLHHGSDEAGVLV